MHCSAFDGVASLAATGRWFTHDMRGIGKDAYIGIIPYTARC